VRRYDLWLINQGKPQEVHPVSVHEGQRVLERLQGDSLGFDVRIGFHETEESARRHSRPGE
jgi:hypothetical protein